MKTTGPFINAVTRVNRDEMIARVRTAMTASGAWVIDVKLFSNISVCFNFEMPASQTERLRDALAATDLHLTKESHASIANLLQCGSTGDVRGSLQITFIHNDPDLKIEVPRIPG